jgi:hypothetical protein
LPNRVIADFLRCFSLVKFISHTAASFGPMRDRVIAIHQRGGVVTTMIRAAFAAQCISTAAITMRTPAKQNDDEEWFVDSHRRLCSVSQLSESDTYRQPATFGLCTYMPRQPISQTVWRVTIAAAGECMSPRAAQERHPLSAPGRQTARSLLSTELPASHCCEAVEKIREWGRSPFDT